MEREWTEGTKQTEETEGRREKRPQTDTDADPEFTQSRKKGQMKPIFLSDSDEEAIMDFVKQYKNLYDKTHVKFKDKHRKEGLWETVTVIGIYLSTLSRSGSRLNEPDMASSHRPSQDKYTRTDQVRTSTQEQT